MTLLRKTIELPIEIVELENQNYHLMLKSKLADRSEAWWIIDTGASKTVFDRNREAYFEPEERRHAQQFQSAGINEGMVETGVGTIKKIRFGTLSIKDWKVALIDLQHVNKIYTRYQHKEITGLLGSDILMAYGCQIDYHRQIIRFHTKPIPRKEA